MPEPLSDDEIEEKIEELDIWGYQLDRLKTRVEFDDYKEAVFFANQVFSLAEKEFHHPSVTVEYGAVEIDLWSHDADGVTERDIALAEKIEEVVRDTEWS